VHNSRLAEVRDQGLATQYWGTANPANAITFIDNWPQDIALFASGEYTLGDQDDSFLFYEWMLRNLHGCARGTMTPTLRREWQEQFDTLFNIDIELTDTCTSCGHQNQPPRDSTRSLQLGLQTTYTVINHSIAAYMNERITGVNCTRCH
jgi:hypothetical protein